VGVVAPHVEMKTRRGKETGRGPKEMSENEKTSVVDFDSVVEFGAYLNRLHGTGHTFEMENPSGRLVDCSLDAVINGFQTFCDCGSERFRVRITYYDHGAGTMGHTDKEFKRRKH
jgi:hypothetical protein